MYIYMYSFSIKIYFNSILLKFFSLQVDTFTSVYKKLTGRDVTFEFPDNYLTM